MLDQPFRAGLTPLGAEMPHLQLSDEPGDNAALWSRMPPMYWAVRTASVRQGVRVLVSGPGRTDDGGPMPLVCSRFFGAGMVLMHATDESYRWSSHPDGRRAYSRYWLQTLRHLSRGLNHGLRSLWQHFNHGLRCFGRRLRLRLRIFTTRRNECLEAGELQRIRLESGTPFQVRHLDRLRARRIRERERQHPIEKRGTRPL